MKFILITIFAIFFLSCGKDSNISYPKSYTFSYLDQSDEGLWLLGTPTNPISLALNTGTYGTYREDLKIEVHDFLKEVFDLQLIELIDESTVRIKFQTPDALVDTIVTYTMEDKEIIIDALEDTDIIYYNSDNDQFVLCGFTNIALPGPNVLNPGPLYNTPNTEDCQQGAGLGDHLDYLLSNNNYASLDTIAIFITRFIYE